MEETKPNEAPPDEIAALRAENAELRRALSQATQRIGRMAQILETVPGAVWEIEGWPDTPDCRTTYVNSRIETILGYQKTELLGPGMFWMPLLHPEDNDAILAHVRSRGAGPPPLHRLIAKDGTVVWFEPSISVLRDEHGKAIGVCGVALDVTQRIEEQRLRAELLARSRELQEEVIHAQAAALEELSTPLIPISCDIMVMPLIGTIDRTRASRVIEALLFGLHKARARYAILDITGVPGVDAQTADALLRAARAVQLLGAQVVLTGIRPEVAQTLIALGTSLDGIVTCGNLESGIAYARRA